MAARFAALALVLFGAAASAAEQPSLLEAAEGGDHAAALVALEAGADVNARGPDGTTALIWAAYNGDAELVERLLAAGADPRAVRLPTGIASVDAVFRRHGAIA